MSDNKIYTTGISRVSEANDVTITSAATLDVWQFDGSKWINRPVRNTETSQTANSGAANDTVISADLRRYTYFTLPTTAAYYEITGVEWKNGTVTNGNCQCGVEQITAIPPGASANDDMTLLRALGSRVLQSGASAVQRNSNISSDLIPGGTLLGVFIWTASATGRYQTATVSSRDNSKAATFGTNLANQEANAFAATTEEPYIKLYYRPVFGT